MPQPLVREVLKSLQKTLKFVGEVLNYEYRVRTPYRVLTNTTSERSDDGGCNYQHEVYPKLQ